jgi:succinate dehydrogenase / fumarate reductase cytochrome b subunit
MRVSGQGIERSPARPPRVAALWRSAVGKKALMAVTGIVLFVYVLVHMLANLQIYQGPGPIDRYAELLHGAPALLWTARVILLAAVLVHIVAGVQLWFQKRAARPVGYQELRPVASSVASRTMIVSGLLILLFVVYHLLDLTFGVANPSFVPLDPYHNMIASFGRAAASAAYVVAMVALGFHLWHGLWSMFQSLGMAGARLTPGVKRFAVVFATAIALGFVSIPVAVLVGAL